MEIINNIKLYLEQDETRLKQIVAKKMQVAETELKHFKILKKSIDARDKNDICFVYNIEASIQPIKMIEEQIKKTKKPQKRIVVIGSGPAGLFCALELAKAGLNPLIIEQGESIDKRKESLNRFFLTGNLNENSNVQFGEGGAGTFSDGKLTTQINNEYCKKVLETFVSCGANEESLYLSKPHLGTDNLVKIVKNMREKIISLGGEFRFNTFFENFNINSGKITKIKAIDEIDVSELVLAIGHSSRKTFQMLRGKNISMQAKNFAVGFRIEHLQAQINKSQFGKFYNHPKLSAADYKLSYHGKERSGYTFCMCPGGVVIPAASEEGGVVTNGMSYFDRNEKNANSALLAEVRLEDFKSNDLFAGIEFQRDLEKASYELGGSDYKAPCQKVGDFLKGRASSNVGEVKPSYLRGYKMTCLNNLLPASLTETLKNSIIDMDRRLKGFNSFDAILTGVETRTSSPIRILRTENLTSIELENLYPCGEGAGYAGGIMSSAVDGIKVANAIIDKYSK